MSVAYDPSGRSKGSATVSFANARQAKAAVAKYDGATIDGRALKVALAADDDAAPPRGRAGSGGGAGGKNVRAGLFGTALRGLGGGGAGGRGGGGGRGRGAKAKGRGGGKKQGGRRAHMDEN